MSDIDLTEAIREASDRLHADSCPEDMCGCRCGHYDREAEIAIRAALPHLEQQIREQVADEIKADREATFVGRTKSSLTSHELAIHAGNSRAEQIARNRKDT